MRLFIAIDFEEGKELFLDLQRKIDKNSARLSLTKTFHLTLKFLGEVDEKRIDDIKNRLSSISFSPFTVKLDSMGVFPNENYIRVIWVGFENGEKIRELQKLVENSLLGMFPREDFKAHITLARVKDVMNKEQLRKNIENIKVEKKEFLVKEFKLMKSTLLPEGPVYEELEKFRAN
jgi:2'-5' RNA ligase